MCPCSNPAHWVHPAKASFWAFEAETWDRGALCRGHPRFRFMLSVNGERDGPSPGTGLQGHRLGSSWDLKGKASYNQKHESDLLGEGRRIWARGACVGVNPGVDGCKGMIRNKDNFKSHHLVLCHVLTFLPSLHLRTVQLLIKEMCPGIRIRNWNCWDGAAGLCTILSLPQVFPSLWASLPPCGCLGVGPPTPEVKGTRC